MRALILTAGAALAISACGDNPSAGNATDIDGDLATQNIAANDTTSLDAATSEDANMAADVNFTVNELDNLADNTDSANSADTNSD
jgi:hypothetical protein